MFIKDLWIADKSLTLEWSVVQPCGGGQRRQVRCGLPFQQLIEDAVPQTVFGQDPVDTLMRLFSACVPEARRVFDGACRPLRLLHANDYIPAQSCAVRTAGSQPSDPPPAGSPAAPLPHPSYTALLGDAGIIRLPNGVRGRKAPCFVPEIDMKGNGRPFDIFSWAQWWLRTAWRVSGIPRSK